MPKKVSFATTNWENKPGKPSTMTQAEWDARNSSKFNGFPFPIHETDEEGNPISQWDKITTFQGQPSKHNNKRVSVLTVNYSYIFKFAELWQLFWNMKKTAPTKGEIRGQETDFRSSVYEYNAPIYGGTESFEFKQDESSNPKPEEDQLVTELDKNYWSIAFTGGGNAGIDFRQPVYKTGPDEYRPFVWCNSCNCGGAFSPCKNIHDSTGGTQITVSYAEKTYTGSLIRETSITQGDDSGEPWWGNGNPPCWTFGSNHCGASLGKQLCCSEGDWVNIFRTMKDGVCGYEIWTGHTYNGCCSANFSSHWGGKIFVPGDSPAGSHSISETGYVSYIGYPYWDEDTQTYIEDPAAYYNLIDRSSTVSISIS